MINYRLKDGERQEALRKALPRFDEMLWRDCYQQMKNDEEYVFVGLPATDDVGDLVSLWKVALRKSDIEIENPYNPNGWNDFPEVQPPEGVLMRIETEGGRKFCGYFHTFPDGVGRWCCVCFTPRHMPLRETEKVRRFRPWE